MGEDDVGIHSGRGPGRRRLRFRAPVSGRRLVLGTGLAVAAAGLAWVLTRPLGGGPWVPLTTGPNFYPIGQERPGLLVGQRAPDFIGSAGGVPVVLTDLDGNPIHLADFAGHPVWIVFWATWCVPCQQEIPDLRAEHELHAPDGLVIVAINRAEAADVVRAYAEAHGLEYLIGLDRTAAVMDTYAGWGLPTHYFVDADGIIRARFLGPMSRQQMDAHLATILEP